jgi:hypothetical protein
MAVFRSPLDLSDLPWLKVFQDYRMAHYIFQVEHRGIYLTDYLGWEDEKDLRKVTQFIIGMQKQINYYLDAIWC